MTKLRLAGPNEYVVPQAVVQFYGEVLDLAVSFVKQWFTSGKESILFYPGYKHHANTPINLAVCLVNQVSY